MRFFLKVSLGFVLTKIQSVNLCIDDKILVVT